MRKFKFLFRLAIEAQVLERTPHKLIAREAPTTMGWSAPVPVRQNALKRPYFSMALRFQIELKIFWGGFITISDDLTPKMQKMKALMSCFNPAASIQMD